MASAILAVAGSRVAHGQTDTAGSVWQRPLTVLDYTAERMQEKLKAAVVRFMGERGDSLWVDATPQEPSVGVLVSGGSPVRTLAVAFLFIDSLRVEPLAACEAVLAGAFEPTLMLGERNARLKGAMLQATLAWLFPPSLRQQTHPGALEELHGGMRLAVDIHEADASRRVRCERSALGDRVSVMEWPIDE